MIDFRYHLVSIVAIFLALGLGILLGATTIEPSVASALKRTADQEAARIGQLYADRSQLQTQISRDGQFASAAEATLLHGLLAGERVVLVEAPGAPGAVTGGVTSALTQAGAVVSGQVDLQSRFFDGTSSTQAALATLAAQLAPAGFNLGSGTPVQQASRVLASAVLTRNTPGTPAAGQADGTGAAILSGFAAQGFLTQTGAPATRADLAVVVIPAMPSSTSTSNQASQTLVTLAQGLAGAGQGVVVAGPVNGSGPGSAIDVMRSGGRAGRMSSVDDADTVIGQIVVAQALAEQLRGVSGSYGASSSADSAGPSPAPTPSPSPSPSASGSVSPSPGSTVSPSTRRGKA